MQRADFDFELPSELIAHFPTKNRTDARLLIGSTLENKIFSDFPNYLRSGDVLVLNDTKVLPARLAANKMTGGKLEVMLDRISNPHFAVAMIKASRAPKIDSEIVFEDGSTARVLSKDGAFYDLEFSANIFELTQNFGKIPLPPYIKRVANEDDVIEYQSVFAKNLGAVAAPTASLHFDEELLAQIKQQGVDIVYLTLHVGSGTFLPVQTENILEHKMHKEYFHISVEQLSRIRDAKQKGGRVVAVGTTVVRTLETIAQDNFQNLSGESDIFIYPGFEFALVDMLVTNFHLPQSTLLMLVSAFAGIEHIKQLYQHAIKEKYRFFSYGDAMLLEKI